MFNTLSLWQYINRARNECEVPMYDRKSIWSCHKYSESFDLYSNFNGSFVCLCVWSVFWFNPFQNVKWFGVPIFKAKILTKICLVNQYEYQKESKWQWIIIKVITINKSWHHRYTRTRTCTWDTQFERETKQRELSAMAIA